MLKNSLEYILYFYLFFKESNDIELKSKWLNAICCLGNEEYFFTIISDNICANMYKNQEETRITLKCLRLIILDNTN